MTNPKWILGSPSMRRFAYTVRVSRIRGFPWLSFFPINAVLISLFCTTKKISKLDL